MKNDNTYLSFNLANEIFGASVRKVLEVLEIQHITKVPRTPEFVRGVINFRGEILPVIDTRMKFLMPPSEDTTKTVIIVLDLKLENKKVMIGATADSVRDVFKATAEDIKQVPEIGSRYNTEFITGMIKRGDSFIMMLDLEKVFSTDDLILINEIEEKEEVEQLEEVD
jgi:purine-binding chemotaxis protein CheW